MSEQSMDALNQPLQEKIALRFGRECADDIRDLILDADERHAAIGLSNQRRRELNWNWAVSFGKAWNRFG